MPPPSLSPLPSHNPVAATVAINRAITPVSATVSPVAPFSHPLFCRPSSPGHRCQARKLKAIGMRSGMAAQTPVSLKTANPAKAAPEPARASRSSHTGGGKALLASEGEGKKKSSMFGSMSKRFSLFGGSASKAAAFAEDFEAQDAGPTVDDLFEEGTQRCARAQYCWNKTLKNTH